MTLDRQEELDRLRLIRSRRVGPATYHRLMAEHGSASAALAALPDVARAAGVADYSPCPVEVAAHEMAQARIAGARMLVHDGAEYPALLAELDDAPPLLWVRGDAGLLARPMVAMVGARNASSLGLRMARRLAATLGESGQVIVSGLARGIDAEAHGAALETGTVAVMAGGVDVVYPDEHAKLAASIAERGCLVSEQPMGLQPQARHFPQRNRIVAGLCRAVIVVEAAARSGSLITAKEALDKGREVMAVPGHPFDPRASGCNMLIRDGAVLVRGAADIFEALGVAQTALPEESDRRPALPGPVPAPRPLSQIADLHSQILQRLGPSPMAEDQLIRDLALPAARVTPELVALELEGVIARQAGGLLSRVQ